MLRMMSACATSSASLARRLIFADLILEVVDELLAMSVKAGGLGVRESMPATGGNSHHWKTVRAEQLGNPEPHFANGQDANGRLRHIQSCGR